MKSIVLLLLCFISGLGVGYINWMPQQSETEVKAAASVRRPPPLVRQSSGNMLYRGAGLAESPQLRSIVGRILKRDSSLNLEEALDKISNSKESFEKKLDALVLLFSHWADVDMEGALKRAEMLENSIELHVVKHEIFLKMIAKDPREAALYYERNRDNMYAQQYYFLPELARQWASLDAEESWGWVAALDDNDHRWKGDAMSAFFSGLDDSPGIREKYLGRVISDARLREDSSVLDIVRDWAKHGFKDTVNWVESLDEKYRGEYWEKVVVGGAEDDFELATSYLPKVRGNGLPGVLVDMAGVIQRNQSHEAALDWMTGYRPKEVRISDFGILSQWSAEDPEGAKSWLRRFSPADQGVRDCALEAYVRSSNDLNHEGTLKMAQEIKSTELQKRAMESALLKWKGEDPAAARQWVDQFAGVEGMKKELKKLFMERERQ